MKAANSKRLLIAALATTIIVLFLWFVWTNVWNRWIPASWKYPQQLRAAQALAEKIERFRATRGRLPNATELGGQLDYESAWTGAVGNFHYFPDPNSGTYRLEYYSVEDDRSYELACHSGHCDFE